MGNEKNLTQEEALVLIKKANNWESRHGIEFIGKFPENPELTIYFGAYPEHLFSHDSIYKMHLTYNKTFIGECENIPNSAANEIYKLVKEESSEAETKRINNNLSHGLDLVKKILED
jgi:hypothetical protein